MTYNNITTITDPTLDLLETLQIYPLEAVIAVVLLIYVAIAETLAVYVHGLKDTVSPTSR